MLLITFRVIWGLKRGLLGQMFFSSASTLFGAVLTDLPLHRLVDAYLAAYDALAARANALGLRNIC